MCIPGYWIGGFLQRPAPRRLLYPLGWGTLGCAFPQALGAALATDLPVVSISGDGGFLYACGELATAAQEKIPLLAVVVDDGGYGMLRFDQDQHGDPHVGVDLDTPGLRGHGRLVRRALALVGGFRRRLHRGDGAAVRAGRALATCDEGRAGAAAERVAAVVPGYSLKSASPSSSATSIWAFWSLPE